MADGQFSDYEEDLSVKVKSVRFADPPVIARDISDDDDVDSDDYFYDSDDPTQTKNKKDNVNPQTPSNKSVEHDHPHAFEFLRKDCTNISDFFRKKGVATLTVKELFDFITDTSINESNLEECLERLSEKVASRNFEEMTAQEQVEEEAFKNVYIPKRLTEVINYERDISKAKKGDTEDLTYKKIAGFNEDLSGTVDKPEILQEDEINEDDDISDGSESGSGSSSIENGNDAKTKFKTSSRPRDESPESKKARKKAVKEEKAEKRKTKTKKHIKKRRDKGSGRK
ncbi:unnamed protein product, partial [Iphiclides podalirius]